MAVSPDTLGGLLRWHARNRPDAPALWFEGVATTYAELDRQSDAVASALSRSGVRRGDRVGYLGKNSDRYFEILFGAARLGAVMTPLNWRLAVPEIAAIVRDARTAMLFVGSEFTSALPAIDEAGAPVGTTVPLDGRAYLRWREGGGSFHAGYEASPQDVTLQLYTSGTTGQPKGVMLTHDNLLAPRRLAAEAGVAWDRWLEDDASLIAMPVCHVSGTVCALMGLYQGARAIVMREFDADGALDTIEGLGVTKLFLVPTALHRLVQRAKARGVDCTRIRHVFYGASPIPQAALKEAMAVLRSSFAQQYGMTETTGGIVLLAPEDHSLEPSARMLSAGRPMPGVEIAVRDTDGRDLPPGEIGEVVTRSPANMAGYWNRPDATAETLDAGGWLHTGDAGYLDEDGYLYLYDRIKDLIISGGENVYPTEVETAISGHPEVAAVAVIGVPDDRWGESVKALIVPKSGTAPDPHAIIAWARQRVAGYKVPKSVDLVESLPRNASGKVLRRQLREPFWAGKDRRVN